MNDRDLARALQDERTVAEHLATIGNDLVRHLTEDHQLGYLAAHVILSQKHAELHPLPELPPDEPHACVAEDCEEVTTRAFCAKHEAMINAGSVVLTKLIFSEPVVRGIEVEVEWSASLTIRGFKAAAICTSLDPVYQKLCVEGSVADAIFAALRDWINA